MIRLGKNITDKQGVRRQRIIKKVVRKKAMARPVISMMLVAFMLFPLTSCGQQEVVTDSHINENLDTSEEVVLRVVGDRADFMAMEEMGTKFTKKYPNCSIVYEYIQDYTTHLSTRLSLDEEKIDLFMTNNIQEDSPFYPYALELSAQGDALDLSNNYEGLIQNFCVSGTQELYAMPLTAEVRGLYVNTTLLAKEGIKVPTNRQELLEACEILKEKGYIPMQGNPSNFGQQLLYPYIASLIANAPEEDNAYEIVAACNEETAELFRDPLEFMYELMEKGYYDYKKQETELGLFVVAETENTVRDFFNIKEAEEGYEKVDDIGLVPFMPGPISYQSTMDRIKEDYHSEIEYQFILAPVSDEGEYAYLSPGSGIAINKNSDHKEWALEFLDFLLETENNEAFANSCGMIPNTSEAFTYVSELFDVPENRICQVGEVTFDYRFYTIMANGLLSISKGNNPKYMEDDGNGNLQLYDFEYYMDNLKNSFTQQREGSEAATE